MSNIQVFNFETSSVRTAINGNNEPYFCLTDVTEVLNIDRTSTLIRNLDEKGVIKLATPTKGGKQEVTFINEPNLYRVIFRSNKAEAVKFQNWVFDEVLPSIRKTGQYRHTISPEQRHTIQKAIKAKCQHNSTHYQTVYHALYDHFKVESYKELLASDFDEAMAFITDFNLADDVSEYNSLWKLIGLLEYERIDKEIRELKRTIDTAYQQIERISRTKGLIYDAISEQKTNCPYNTNRLNEAKAFIEKQMVLKKQLGLIA